MSSMCEACHKVTRMGEPGEAQLIVHACQYYASYRVHGPKAPLKPRFGQGGKNSTAHWPHIQIIPHKCSEVAYSRGYHCMGSWCEKAVWL
jgi:hypothetical protein